MVNKSGTLDCGPGSERRTPKQLSELRHLGASDPKAPFADLLSELTAMRRGLLVTLGLPPDRAPGARSPGYAKRMASPSLEPVGIELLERMDRTIEWLTRRLMNRLRDRRRRWPDQA